MKLSAVSITVLVALLGLSLLSAFAMQPMTMDDHETGNCLASTALQTPCPVASTADDFAAVALHTDFITGFSNAIFAGSLLLLMLALFALLWRLSRELTHNLPLRTNAFSSFIADTSLHPTLAAMRAWTALLEHSPTLAYARTV